METARKIIIVICAIVFIFSLYSFTQSYYQKKQAEDKYEDLRESVFETTQEVTTALESETETEPIYVPPANLQAEFDKYPDMVGWISIADTKIDYPVMYKSEDNEYYLHRDIDGNESVSGAIYLDSNHDIDEQGMHVIYGHHMKNGTMFKDIVKFSDEDYLKSHQDIVIYGKDKEVHLTPVYCYAGTQDPTYRLKYTNKDELDAFLKEKTGSTIQNNGNIYVLITCSYGASDERTYLICTEQ